ncbi:Inner membrane protein YohD [Fundidesulfovibrio magnetotacticus]|uniref:Inner membrane protein YohD n=1 Tax=Fundidesulfovibrio magnetotacticus TaxID=2730080 RepID=A0A6V8LUX0_9BACT|nr:DedA family protein [Fundidesulfovibrio magnetotacticus]GFK95544.1 Inner membrane protein YohD [Fundidesulfovibrio magnetotacticus]
MSLSPSQLLAQYGYLAVFLGSVVEGESILLLAGFAAHQGYLDFWAVAALACLGGSLGDQAFFLLGRRYGQAMLDRFPRLKVHAATVDRLVARYRAGVIVMVRFLYGLRVAGPVALGMGDTPLGTFAAFNLLGAAVWALLVSGAGYVFGHALNLILEDARRWEEAALVLLALFAVGLWFGRRGFMRRRDILLGCADPEESGKKRPDGCIRGPSG